MTDFPMLSGEDVRARARSGALSGPTCGLAPGYLQANLVIVRAAIAPDLMRFCELNPKPCPILEVLDPGAWEPRRLAKGADIRTDLPRYRIYRQGVLEEEVADITRLWRRDLVAFLLGCSFSFEHALQRANLPLRHVEQRCTVPMYKTNLRCRSAGLFSANLVVSMRPLTPTQAGEAAIITSRYPLAHGAPVHFGDPETLGIRDLLHPDFGDAVSMRPEEIPVFWACGMTSQDALISARPEIGITHAPGCMFVTDQLADDGDSGRPADA